MDEVRGIVLPHDIEHFDELILGMEVAAMGKVGNFFYFGNLSRRSSPITVTNKFFVFLAEKQL